MIQGIHLDITCIEVVALMGLPVLDLELHLTYPSDLGTRRTVHVEVCYGLLTVRSV